MKAIITWYDVLHQEKKKYFIKLMSVINYQRLTKLVYPSRKQVFRAFLLTELYKIKVVILGQDPYYNQNQADGLAFSVPNRVSIPPSLKNIFKELKSNFPKYCIPQNGSLVNWAKQGVFLINTSLTVEAGNPGSHTKLGWDKFTNKVITIISSCLSGVIFLLWGNHAQSKECYINKTKHYILKAAHPSPLSAFRGFFGCTHFKLVNQILIRKGQMPIIW